MTDITTHVTTYMRSGDKTVSLLRWQSNIPYISISPKGKITHEPIERDALNSEDDLLKMAAVLQAAADVVYEMSRTADPSENPQQTIEVNQEKERKTMDKQEPDRYSMIFCHPSELIDKINHAQQLGLRWFVRSDFSPDNRALLYLFFDELGLQKYLSKEWGNKLDTVVGWVEELTADKISDGVFVQRVIELFD